MIFLIFPLLFALAFGGTYWLVTRLVKKKAAREQAQKENSNSMDQ